MLTGYMKSKGLLVGENKVMKLLHEISPTATAQRRGGVRISNPIPYQATHFGHKIHFDQNEKLLQFGVFHAACIDGFTSKIIKHVILPEKNNILLYELMFKPIIEEYGIWDSLRVDYGTEWFLVLYAQELLGSYRVNQDKPSYTQTYSKKYLRIERWWVEVNKRVNYPIKEILLVSDEQREIPCADDSDRLLVSEFTRRVCQIGITKLTSAWNNHRIDRRGTPNSHPVTSIGIVPSNAIIPTNDMVLLYEQHGGKLTRPLPNNAINDKILEMTRDEYFFSLYGNFDHIYRHIMIGNKQAFVTALKAYVSISKNYQPV